MYLRVFRIFYNKFLLMYKIGSAFFWPYWAMDFSTFTPN